MLKWTAQLAGIYFEISQHAGILALSDWDNPARNPEHARVPLLLELLQNGQALSEAQGILVPYAEIIKLDPDEHQSLGLPLAYPYSLLVRSHSVASDPEFRLIGEYYRFLPGGEQLFFKRTGSLLQADNQAFMLSEPQYLLMETLSATDGVTGDGLDAYRRIQAVQSLAPASGAQLEAYLADERIILPEQFELELKWNADQTISVLPALAETSSQDFGARFERTRRVRRIYNLELEDGQSARIVLQPEQQQALEALQPLQRLSGEAQEQFLAHPEGSLDPEVFNLERFSQRVVEWGLYKPRYQPFVSPVKNEWIPGILVDLGAGEQQQIRIPDQMTLDSLAEAIQTAEAHHDSQVAWRQQQIPLETARQLHAFAGRQLARRDSRPEAGEARVLIISENLDELEFTDFLATPEAPGLHLETYAPPPWLAEGQNLLAHQQAGLAWMQALYHGGYSGGLLADDMGLGKTLQTLSLMMWVLQHTETPAQCLIVAPVSLLENWEQEYRRFFPTAPITVYQAYGAALNQLDGPQLSRTLSERTQLVLTTYETLRKKQLGFCAVDWQVVVLDEAQRIKTPGTLTTNAAKALKARLKLAATGTPIENSLMDIWCILDFAAPGLLNSASAFRARYRCNDEEADLLQLGQNLRQDIGFYLLRRLKRDVLNALPAKSLYQHEVPMPPVQASAYADLLSELQNFAGSEAYGAKVLETLHHLKSVSEHPFLRMPERLLEPINELVAASAKLQATLDILLEIQKKAEKVVIFAERRGTQHLLYRLLAERFALTPGIVNGDTPARPQRGALSRQQSIDRFQALPGFAAIIMSPLAAGVGLNVTAANHVIHYGRHWNPAKEDQATDRVYRLGQTRPVHVHLPLAVSPDFKTFDLVLHELLERKRQLAESSLVPEQAVSLRPTEVMAALLNKSDTLSAQANLHLEV